jgi:hypothetical protein
MTMMKKLILSACVLTSLTAMAADVQPANVAQAQSHDKKSLALQCQQQATEKKLEGAEKKQFLVKCINPAAAKVVPLPPAK